MCAHLSGLFFTPCFRVQKIDYRSFRGSLSGMGFAYCDFYQRNTRSQLISGLETPVATPIPATQSPASLARPLGRTLAQPLSPAAACG